MRYFGYGSNLDADEAALGASEVAWLPDAEAVLHSGALEVRERPGSAVPGMLFEVDNVGWDALDRREGNRIRVERTVLTERGEPVRAFLYTVVLNTVAPRSREARHVDTRSWPGALFVYGTLMRGEAEHPRIGGARISTAYVRGALVSLGEYPGLVEGERIVHGELAELDDLASIGELDDYEGFTGYDGDSLFRRILVRAHLGDDRSALAWAYRYTGAMEHATHLASGDWRRR